MIDDLIVLGATPDQEEWLGEVLTWPELPCIHRHRLEVTFGAEMSSDRLAFAGAGGIVFSERIDSWRFDRFATIVVHEWAHVWDANHLTQARRNHLMAMSNVPEHYTWRAQHESYRSRPIERFAGTVTQLICPNRVGTAGLSHSFTPLDLNLVRRYTMPFSDTDDLTDEELKALQWALANDLIAGYPDGTFRPSWPLTRIQYVVLEYRAQQ